MAELPVFNFNEVQKLVHWSKELIYDQIGFSCTEPNAEAESMDYGAATFLINDKRVRFRVAKITPTKVGQFVTIWKRNAKGITEPFSNSDLDFIIVVTQREANIGQFIFPASTLMTHGVISKNGKGGKRGMRVYPPWDKTTNNQANKTQQWQLRFFVDFTNEINLESVKHFFLN
jgi:hypothetical protein